MQGMLLNRTLEPDNAASQLSIFLDKWTALYCPGRVYGVGVSYRQICKSRNDLTG